MHRTLIFYLLSCILRKKKSYMLLKCVAFSLTTMSFICTCKSWCNSCSYFIQPSPKWAIGVNLKISSSNPSIFYIVFNFKLYAVIDSLLSFHFLLILIFGRTAAVSEWQQRYVCRNHSKWSLLGLYTYLCKHVFSQKLTVSMVGICNPLYFCFMFRISQGHLPFGHCSILSICLT